MLSTLWHAITSICFYIPWLIMAVAAGMVYSKHQKSRPAFLEVLGALAYVVISGVDCVFIWGFTKIKIDNGIISKMNAVFSFLEVVAMLVFAVGFCWEKFQQWRLPADPPKSDDPGTPATATAVPVS